MSDIELISDMARVEVDIESQMEMVLYDWELYRAVKGTTAARE
jgi:hypothetical protein